MGGFQACPRCRTAVAVDANWCGRCGAQRGTPAWPTPAPQGWTNQQPPGRAQPPQAPWEQSASGTSVSPSLPITFWFWRWFRPKWRSVSAAVRVGLAALFALAALVSLYGPLVFDASYWVLGKIARVRVARPFRTGVSIAIAALWVVALMVSSSGEQATGAVATPTGYLALGTHGPTYTSSAPSTARPTPTPSPTASPPPSPNPHALTVANVTKSLRDNQNYMWPYTTFDDLKVTIEPSGKVVDVEANPSLVLSDATFLQSAGADALVAARAILGWYPTVQRVHVALDKDFIDRYGTTTTKVSARLVITLATAKKFNYVGMNNIDPTIVFCDAESYWVYTTVWDGVWPFVPSCMKTSSKG